MLLAKKIHPYDGTYKSGRPVGSWLKVVDLIDHNPVDGQIQEKCIILMEDGSWEFIWNVVLYNLCI